MCACDLFRLLTALKKLGTEEEKLNMKRMKDVIHRKILESQSSVSLFARIEWRQKCIFAAVSSLLAFHHVICLTC